ncbi:GntR family transcriptional regulator [Streptomyces sp. NA04227]|uniref:GntR family transcriptional regulator n=1 Tax=Streptomyces sp. NA04227 TaxID=2742136 RepID=UPI001591DF15|nr:GntR family transcriptional regulator [Streptomyces sp. NA04227]QKW07443.1 GntR family transcriptional regulator [Streptomyces sp. NA04227]
MPGSSAVTRSTLRQQIADALRDEVLSGRLEPGQEFTVKEIADQYGVSATPVREALVDLAAQGLLDSVQHRGFCVHEFSLADYRGMIEARSLIADAIFAGVAARGAAGSTPGATQASGAVPASGATPASAPVSPASPGSTPHSTSTDEPARDADEPAPDADGRAPEGGGRAPGSDEPAPDPSARPARPGPGQEPGGVIRVELLAAVRRRGEEAQRAAAAGDLNVLIGYDLRFWREVSSLYGNPYLADFLGRLRLQSWVCVMPLLRRAGDLRGRLWSGHTELADALARHDAHAAHAIITEYNSHALALVEDLASRESARET